MLNKLFHSIATLSLLFMTFCIGECQQAMIQKYTINDGLVMNRVRGFHQDAEGFIWIYTWDGLSRYEGNRFRNYVAGTEINHGLINDMLESPDGSIYVALNDGTVEVIKDLEVRDPLFRKETIINVFIKDKQGKILAGTDFKGICLFEKNHAEPISDLPDDIAIHAGVVKNNTLFMSSVKDLIIARIIYEGNTIKRIETVQQWKDPGDFFKAVFMDKNGNIFVGTRIGLKQLVPIPHVENKYELIDPQIVSPEAPWKNWFPVTMTQSEDGTYWIGTDYGLIRLKSKNDWSILTTSDNLPSNSISSLFIDRNHILWIGTDLGVASLNLVNSIERFSHPNCVFINYLFAGPAGDIYCQCENQYVYGMSATGELKGLLVHKKYLFGLLAHQEKVYLLQDDGIFPLQTIPLNEHFKARGFPKNGTVLNNRIFLLTYDGLFRCTPEGHCVQLNVMDYRKEVICALGDQLLMGTWNDGLFVGRQDKNDSTRINVMKNLNKWLPGKEIRNLMISRSGDIWVATRYHGITRLVCNDELDSCKAQTFTMNNGLIGNWTTSMVEDDFGNIWVGSMSGIDKLIPQGDGYRVFSYSRVFGFYDVINHMTIGTDGTVWAGTSAGFARIRDGGIDSLSSPPVYITQAVLGGDDQLNSKETLKVLPYDHNTVKFAFSAPDYTSEKQLKFSYRLLGGSDTLWSEPQINHEIFFSNLQPGDYTFEVAAFGWNGKMGEPASYHFRITPPYWRQFWFVALIIICIALILYGLYRFRIAQIQRIQAVRERIASDLHDEIGSSLSHVNILAEIGKQSIAKSGKPIEILERIGAEVQNSSEALDDIIWSVKTRWDVMGDVVARMRQYATEIFEPVGITFKITEQMTVDPHPDMEFRRDLFLVYKEILRNIIRHANATHVVVQIVVEQKLVKLSVTDNGKGFNIDHPTNRSGLSNIRQRAARWKGNAEWISTPGSGTTVSVNMKPG